MTAEEIDISGLDGPQKVALMERLWAALAREGEAISPPAWHADALAEREREWVERSAVAEDWTTVREELRQDIR